MPVTVTISPRNAAPVAGTSTLGTPDSTSGVVTGRLDVSDADSDTLTYGGSGTTPNGSLVVNSNGTFSYTPTTSAQHAASALTTTNTEKTDTFIITVADGHGGTVSVPITVNILATNAVPVAGTPVTAAPLTATGVVTGSLPGTDSDGDTLVYSGSTTTSKGAVVVASDGTFT